MTMKRGIIRMTEGGKVSMPLTDVWMTKEEIADMFGLPEALILRTIRSIYKKSEQYEHETANRIPFPKQESKGWTKEVYPTYFILLIIATFLIRSKMFIRMILVSL